MFCSYLALTHYNKPFRQECPFPPHCLFPAILDSKKKFKKRFFLCFGREREIKKSFSAVYDRNGKAKKLSSNLKRESKKTFPLFETGMGNPKKFAFMLKNMWQLEFLTLLL